MNFSCLQFAAASAMAFPGACGAGTATSLRRDAAEKSHFAIIRDYSSGPDLRAKPIANEREQPRTMADNQGASKNGLPVCHSPLLHSGPKAGFGGPFSLVNRPVARPQKKRAYHFLPDSGGYPAEKMNPAKHKTERLDTMSTKVILTTSGAPRHTQGKRTILGSGDTEVVIRFETPRGNRKPYRVEWTEFGIPVSTMYDTWDEAMTQAEAVCAHRASGKRTLVRWIINQCLCGNATSGSIAKKLNRRHVRTFRRGGLWTYQ